MSDRDIILSRVRNRAPSPAPAAQPVVRYQTFDDPAAHFAEVLASVGGRAEFVAADAVDGALEQLAREVGAERAWCAIAPGSAEPPSEVAALQLFVVAGEIAVAENAAVWVVPETVRHRAALFLAEHVALVVERRVIVHNMHEGYAAIDAAATGFGVFISGPSKTADIEQALVIGAHGPRSLTVFVIEGKEKS